MVDETDRLRERHKTHIRAYTHVKIDAEIQRMNDVFCTFHMSSAHTHTHMHTHTQHNLFDLHELNAANPTRNNPLEPVILAERLARAQKDAESQREERGAAEKRCEELQQQNELLRADLALAVGEGIKYREALREWAEIEEQRLAQGAGAGAPAPGEDVGVLKREVEMLREARQKETAAAKEKFERELRRSEADVLVLKVQVCF